MYHQKIWRKIYTNETSNVTAIYNFSLLPSILPLPPCSFTAGDPIPIHRWPASLPMPAGAAAEPKAEVESELSVGRLRAARKHAHRTTVLDPASPQQQ